MLDAAERLIAEHGVDAVSLRAINAEAGANVAAIHYHYGTKVDLLRAVLTRRSGQLGRARREQLVAAGPDADVRAIVEVAVRPFLELARGSEGGRWAGFLAELERSGEPWSGLVREVLGPQWTPIADALARALPDLTTEERSFRFASVGAIISGPALAPEAPDIDTIVDIATAIVLAPAPVH